MEKITDIQLYNTQMAKSMKDKVFFLDKINPNDIDNIVDFGCANGELFKYVPNSWSCIGVDNSDDMIKEAKANFNDAAYVHSLDEVRPYIEDNKNTNYLLNMSSVIHEVYSYCSKNEIAKFWDNVWNSGYKYITIRDMMVGESIYREPDELADELFIPDKSLHNYNSIDFASTWDYYFNASQWHLIHYLLKYKYVENWERENKENYLPITFEELIAMIPDTYEIIFLDRYTLPYLKDTVYADFGYTITDPTHIKIILEKK